MGVQPSSPRAPETRPGTWGAGAVYSWDWTRSPGAQVPRVKDGVRQGAEAGLGKPQGCVGGGRGGARQRFNLTQVPCQELGGKAAPSRPAVRTLPRAGRGDGRLCCPQLFRGRGRGRPRATHPGTKEPAEAEAPSGLQAHIGVTAMA